MHVGDLYYVDVAGARNSGIRPMLIDPIRVVPGLRCRPRANPGRTGGPAERDARGGVILDDHHASRHIARHRRRAHRVERLGRACAVLERGTIVDRVQCAGDPGQTYALYLPSTYSPERKWNLVLAFHPAARGRLMVEKFQAAAEQYGYIIAASNNSRNGPYAVSQAAAQAMSTDVGQRFSIDPQRVYLAGMSGGARVATGIALAKNNIAGIIASSAGYPDSQPRASVPFAIFSTAGTEDFNYMEMRLLDRKLTSPHFLAVFQGGHTLPPDDVAFDALEWMEIQAMQSGRRGRDDALVKRIVEKRRTRLAATDGLAETVYLLTALVSDFKGLADVSAEATRLEQLSRQADVKQALKRERDADSAEGRMLEEIFGLEGASVPTTGGKWR